VVRADSNTAASETRQACSSSGVGTAAGGPQPREPAGHTGDGQASERKLLSLALTCEIPAAGLRAKHASPLKKRYTCACVYPSHGHRISHLKNRPTLTMGRARCRTG
jgi:hypothetical protein